MIKQLTIRISMENYELIQARRFQLSKDGGRNYSINETVNEIINEKTNQNNEQGKL